MVKVGPGGDREKLSFVFAAITSGSQCGNDGKEKRRSGMARRGIGEGGIEEIQMFLSGFLYWLWRWKEKSMVLIFDGVGQNVNVYMKKVGKTNGRVLYSKFGGWSIKILYFIIVIKRVKVLWSKCVFKYCEKIAKQKNIK